MDIAYAAVHKRDHMDKRLAFLAESCDDGVRLLARYAQGETPDKVVLENRLPQPGSLAFVYTGNGALWRGMGRHLLATSQKFLEILIINLL